MSFFAVVMAGGKGTRFWPYSVRSKPKQYLQLVGTHSLLEQTLMRLDPLISPEDRFIVTVQEQSVLAQENSHNLINKSGLIFEPEGRNTGPCILLALAHLLVHATVRGVNHDSVVAILPSDHVILNTQAFRTTLNKAFLAAQKHNAIVTIGIRPNFPHTGYGYINAKDSLGDALYKVHAFKEKPNLETATQYLREGGYYWNAGMFVGSIGTFLEEFKLYAPAMYQHMEELIQAIKKANTDAVTTVYKKMPKESIDYAVMEKSQKILVLEAAFDWNDLGSWDALESVCQKNEGNVLEKVRGAYANNAKGNIVFAPSKFVALINVNDLAIVESGKVLMVLPKKDSQQVKQVVEFLEKSSQYRDLL
ncbi:MAG: mannose-1-phosphate guanylyltransferase [Bdellovibrio sp.]|nr:mannose-1-phosphate guanylyltransferase [Bdellovibrio sp.]